MSRVATRRIAIAGLVAGLAAAALIVKGAGSSGHRLSAVVPAAANLVKGNEINGSGQQIGVVTDVVPVNGGRAARIELRIDDEDYWPLQRTSTAQVRIGGTVSFVNRYVLIRRGKGTGDPIPEGGMLPPANVTVPVEVDTVVSKVTPEVQTGIKRLITEGADTVDRAGEPLRRVLPKAPPVLDAASSVLGDLTKNEQQLSSLVTTASGVVDGVDRANPDVQVLIDGLAQTFDTVAAEQGDLKLSLSRLPDALRQTRTTLATADVTLREAAQLTDDLAPGVDELRRIAAPLTGVLASLRDVTPSARRTLDAVDRGLPVVEALDQLADVTPDVGSIGRKTTEQLKCIRPYTPELVQFGTTWGDWMTPVDNRDHVVRATIQSFLPANFNSVPSTPAEVVARNPGIEYAFPRPPGQLAGQPWFLPECGAGRDALDPSKDQEAANYKAGVDNPPDLDGTP